MKMLRSIKESFKKLPKALRNVSDKGVKKQRSIAATNNLSAVFSAAPLQWLYPGTFLPGSLIHDTSFFPRGRTLVIVSQTHCRAAHSYMMKYEDILISAFNTAGGQGCVGGMSRPAAFFRKALRRLKSAMGINKSKTIKIK